MRRGSRAGLFANADPGTPGAGGRWPHHAAPGDRGCGTATAMQSGPPCHPFLQQHQCVPAHWRAPPLLKVFVCFLLRQVCSGKGHVPLGFPSPRPAGLVSQLPAFLVQPGRRQGLAQLIKHTSRDSPRHGLCHGQGTVPAALHRRLGDRSILAGTPLQHSPPALPAQQTPRLRRALTEGTVLPAASPPRNNRKCHHGLSPGQNATAGCFRATSPGRHCREGCPRWSPSVQAVQAVQAAWCAPGAGKRWSKRGAGRGLRRQWGCVRRREPCRGQLPAAALRPSQWAPRASTPSRFNAKGETEGQERLSQASPEVGGCQTLGNPKHFTSPTAGITPGPVPAVEQIPSTSTPKSQAAPAI